MHTGIFEMRVLGQIASGGRTLKAEAVRAVPLALLAAWVAFGATAAAQTDALDVTPEGHVGIGTTTPPAKLTVVGGSGISEGIQVQDVTTDSTPKAGRLKIGHYDNSEEPVILIVGQTLAGANLLNIGGGSSSENAATRIVFYAAGNHSTLLGDLVAVITSDGSSFGDEFPDAHLEISADGTTGGNVFLVSSNDDNDGDLLTVAESGRVGIGTSSPTQVLHVNKNTTGNVSMRIENDNADWDLRSNTIGDFAITAAGSGVNELTIEEGTGDVTIVGTLVTGGTCSVGCDGVFRPDEYTVESIEAHAAYMWKNQHLWGVGPTPKGQPINLSQKTTGILHELEKAHIYIEQLNQGLKAREAENAELKERLANIERSLGLGGD